MHQSEFKPCSSFTFYCIVIVISKKLVIKLYLTYRYCIISFILSFHLLFYVDGETSFAATERLQQQRQQKDESTRSLNIQIQTLQVCSFICLSMYVHSLMTVGLSILQINKYFCDNTHDFRALLKQLLQICVITSRQDILSAFYINNILQLFFSIYLKLNIYKSETQFIAYCHLFSAESSLTS